MNDVIENADKYTDEAVKAAKKPLLHVCCAPCACGVLPRVISARPTLYFYNPNIDTAAEFEKRLREVEKLAALYGLPLIVEPYDHDDFLACVKGEENATEGGSRCAKCIALRIRKTALKATEGGFTEFCTTLSVSPHKSARLINELGLEAEKATGVIWIPSDFKKRNGFYESTVKSREMGLYRQVYCGCEFAKERK